MAKSASAVEILTLTAAGVPNGAGFSESVTLATGDIAKVVYAAGPSNLDGDLEILEVTVGAKVFRLSMGSLGSSAPLPANPVIVGPASLRLRKENGSVAYPGLITLSITRAGESAPATPANAVVIPEDADGEFQVILESSTDLVTWTAAMPGTYGGSTQKRFFRTRVVRLN